MKEKFQGLMAATFTPFKDDGSLNIGLIPDIVDHLERTGVAGLYINGSTGEGPSLTMEERRAVAEAYVEAARGRLKTVVQVGSNSLRESRALAEHAQGLQADAISATCPSYFKPTDLDSLVACLAEITAGAPETPYYYYHIPVLTGVRVNMVDFLKNLNGRLPTLVGVKFSSPELHEFHACMAVANGAYEMLSAQDETLLAGAVLGAKGAVGSTYNYAAPIYLRILDAVERSDLAEARRWQLRALEMISALYGTCGRAGLKVMMSLIGFDCGPTRLPITNASPEQVATLKEHLQDMGFYAWIEAQPQPV